MKLKLWAGALACALATALASGVAAQPGPTHNSNGAAAYDYSTDTFRQTCVSGCSTASLWTPDVASLVTPAPTTTAGSTALGGSGANVLIKNTGTQAFHYRLGTASTGQDATATDERLQPGQYAALARGANTYVSLKTDSGTGAAEVTTGSGSPLLGISADLTGTSAVKGGVADGGTPDPAVLAGCRVATTLPTSQADAKQQSIMCGGDGRIAFVPYGPRELTGNTALISLTDTTETSLLAAGSSGVFNDLTWVKVCNKNATTVADVDFRDVTAGTVRDSWHVPPDRCTGGPLPTTLKQTTAASAWTVKEQSTVSSVTVIATYVQRK